MPAQWWMVVPGNIVLSVLVLFIISWILLYPARKPMHGVLRSMTRSLAGPLRMGARWLQQSAAELHRRNRVVLLARGQEEITQEIAREFQRVTQIVQRDLQSYPALQRKLMDELTRIEEDYQKSGEVPPPPPEWVEAVAAVAKIKPSADSLVQKILQDISDSLDEIYAKILSQYRKSCEERHDILKGFMPFWRSVNETFAHVDKNMISLQEASKKIDSQMDRYEQIRKGSDKAEHSLTASATTQFIIAALVLLIAAGGAFVNFKLIALPMSAMVGAGDHITANLQASDIAALVILLVEATMGLFLLETMRMTHLFPRINHMEDKLRQRLMWVSLIILTTLAGVEVALAVMRDTIVAANIELTRSLSVDSAKAAAHAVEHGWVTKIPALGQMILGFILPFALAFIGIPLEYFIHSARTVFGMLLVIAIRSASFVLRVLGNLMRYLGNLLVHVYDVLIFIPLLIERAIVSTRDKPSSTTQFKQSKAA
jgi:hypothetical protein